jgi:hypothetical protein
VLGLRTAQNRLPKWASRIALMVGVMVAGFAAFLTHSVSIAAPLFAQSTDVPSVSEPAPSPQVAAAIDQARSMARAAIMEQNLPGASIAVGVGGTIVWAEGFGWRDVVTRTPVTSKTRFNIGTAASAVTAANVGPLGLTNTGAEAATAWSPEHVGEPEEDFPPFTFMRHHILQPIGLAPAEYPLPGDRATFYVPTTFWKDFTSDPRVGRRLMPMRDLACCANGMAFYSTPSDLVRFAIATQAASVNGELAGGSVMSLMADRNKAIVVAVTSNIAYANTAALAQKVADTFQKCPRESFCPTLETPVVLFGLGISMPRARIGNQRFH